jgi:hypothetical protein
LAAAAAVVSIEVAVAAVGLAASVIINEILPRCQITARLTSSPPVRRALHPHMRQAYPTLEVCPAPVIPAEGRMRPADGAFAKV